MDTMKLQAFWPGIWSLSLPADFRVNGNVVGQVTKVEPAEVEGTHGYRFTIECSNEDYRTILNAVNPVDATLPYSIGMSREETAGHHP